MSNSDSLRLKVSQANVAVREWKPVEREADLSSPSPTSSDDEDDAPLQRRPRRRGSPGHNKSVLHHLRLRLLNLQASIEPRYFNYPFYYSFPFTLPSLRPKEAKASL